MNKTTKDHCYTVGDRIHIGHLKGEDDRYDGREGVIELIDDRDQLHGTWGGLALIPHVDSFSIIK